MQWSIRFRTPLLALAGDLANRVPGNQKAVTKKWADDQIRMALQQVLDINVTGTKMDDLILAEADRIRAERDAEPIARLKKPSRKKAKRKATQPVQAK